MKKTLLSLVALMALAIHLNAQVTYTVTVPEGTPACYIAHQISGSSDWVHEQMTKIEDEWKYTITLTESPNFGTGFPQYKYCIAGNWDFPESKTWGNSGRDNRWTVSATMDDDVVGWEHFYIAIVPSGTPECYIAGDFSKTGNDWNPPVMMSKLDDTHYYFEAPLAGSTNGNKFKFYSGSDWKYVEKNPQPADVNGNRYYPENIRTAPMTVSSWSFYDDKFALFYGIENETWQSVELGDDGDGNKFTAKLTVPSENSENYKCYVGYNSNSQFDPVYVSGKSNTVPMSSVSGFKTGKVIVTIYKDSPDQNWYLAFSDDITTSIDNVGSDAIEYFTGKGFIQVQFDGTANISIYSVNGLLIDQTIATGDYRTDNLSKGIYLVKIDGKTYKAAVK